MDRIFVQIASYRDPECARTIEDLFAKAAHPERVFVGLCAQDDPDLDARCKVPEHERVRRIEVSSRDSKGVCWARALVQSLWAGEELTLLTDAHMRFVPGWDEQLIAELAECRSPKPLLSCNPARYDPPDLLEPNAKPSVRAMNPFAPDGALRGRAIRLDAFPDRPLNGAFVACGFLFARGEIIREVPYDPRMYFSQEEVTLAARLWTHGWDIYSSRRVTLYHHYYDQTRPLHWKDGDAWRAIDALASQRMKQLLSMEPARDPAALVELEKFGLGTARSLGDYERYSGLYFSRREVTERAREALFVEELDLYRRPRPRAPLEPPPGIAPPAEPVAAQASALRNPGAAQAIAARSPGAVQVIAAQAPVVLLPDVLDPALCAELRALWAARESKPGTVGLGPQNRVEPKIKLRREYHLSLARDRALLERIDRSLQRALLPEIARVWQWHPPRRETYKLCCYEAKNAGHYAAHRDNTDPALRYRKLSLTINLNDDYEGGELQFPEYGEVHYRPGAGGAVLFPGVLLHRALPVTRGERYMLVSFLFEEGGPPDSGAFWERALS